VADLALIEGELRPGLVPRGFAEKQLARLGEVTDPLALWRGAAFLGTAAQQWNATSMERRELKTAQMFYEIQLARLLGPRPGVEQGEDGRFLSTVPHAVRSIDGLIPQQRISELQRLHRWADSLIEAVRNGTVSRRGLLLLADEWEAGERPATRAEDVEIRRGDFRAVLADVEPGSVALVLTDPPYPAEYLPLWGHLGMWAAVALAEGGSLVAYCGQSILPEALARLGGSLRYWWTLCLLHRQTQMIPGKYVSATWKPVVWFVRERRATQTMLIDSVQGGTARKTIPTGETGDWAQGVEELGPIISALTAPGDLIVDPFAGSGTVGLAALRYGRRFIGAEVRG
jgi:hypothetical protein